MNAEVFLVQTNTSEFPSPAQRTGSLAALGGPARKARTRGKGRFREFFYALHVDAAGLSL
jgi:hypothetical protein